jgi:hypothetical protein
VTDDLVVTPMSSFNAISHLNSSNVSQSYLDEQVVSIGQKEVRHCLRSQLVFSFNPISKFHLHTLLKCFVCL